MVFQVSKFIEELSKTPVVFGLPGGYRNRSSALMSVLRSDSGRLRAIRLQDARAPAQSSQPTTAASQEPEATVVGLGDVAPWRRFYRDADVLVVTKLDRLARSVGDRAASTIGIGNFRDCAWQINDEWQVEVLARRLNITARQAAQRLRVGDPLFGTLI